MAFVLKSLDLPKVLLLWRWQGRCIPSGEISGNGNGLIFINPEADRSADLADQSQRWISNLENVLVKPCYPVIRGHGVWDNEWIGQFVPSGENDLVHAL